MPNMKGLAQTILTWEGKVFADADADAAETNWKHKVTPDRDDLITYSCPNPSAGMNNLCYQNRPLNDQIKQAKSRNVYTIYHYM